LKFHLLIILLVLPAVAMGEDSNMSSSIKDVKTRHEAQLLQMPGVVSVGIGRDENGQPAIIIGLERPDPETESRLPARLEGYPVRIQTVGRIDAQ
jgi:hypothetical protein